MTIDLDSLKKHLRIDPVNLDDDGVLHAHALAAWEITRRTTGLTVAQIQDSEAAQLAIRMIVGHWYLNREATGFAAELPLGAETLLSAIGSRVGIA